MVGLCMLGCVIKIAVMQVISKGDSARRLPKQRSDLQLPKISKSPCPESGCYQMRYEWVTRSSEYLLLSNHEVQQEHEYLLAQLASLQDEQLRITQTNSNPTHNTKPLRRSHQANVAQNRERQIENNNALIWKLRNQVELLQKQAGSISKEGIQGAIGDAKEKLVKTKQKIKEIKQKSRQMCDSFENGQDYFEEVQRLEHERDGLQYKRLKVQQKYNASIANAERLETKLTEIEGQVLYAQNFLEDYYSNYKNQAAEKDIENQQRQKTYQIQILRKTIESQRSTKQQKCHQLLKALQTQVQKLQLLEKKYQSTQIKGLYQKKELIELQQSLNELQIAAKERAPTSGSLQARSSPSYQQSDSIKQPFKLAQIKQIRYRHHLDHEPAKKAPHSSRTKTSGYYYEPKANQTEILKKPPTSEVENGDMTRMISQALPVNRGYFRTSRSKIAPTADKIDLHSKTAVVGGRNQVDSTRIREEIQEQSPDKETIDKNTIEVKLKQQGDINQDIRQKEQQTQYINKAQGEQIVANLQEQIQCQEGQKIEQNLEEYQGKAAQKEQKIQSINESCSKGQQQVEIHEKVQLIDKQPTIEHVKEEQIDPQQLRQPQPKIEASFQQPLPQNLPQQVSKPTKQQQALVQKRDIINKYVNQFDPEDPDQQQFR